MSNLPSCVYSVAQVRELEQKTIHHHNVPSLELMTRAGLAVFGHLRGLWPNAQKIVVFCGAGNNAGDGYIVASLARQAELTVTVFSVVNPQTLKGDALEAYQHYLKMGGVITEINTIEPIEADVIVDALLGTGLNKSVSGQFEQAIWQINTSRIPVIAVDVPSGLNADTGRVMGHAVHASCTVTFIGLKKGLLTGQATDYCGQIFYDSLEVPESVFAEVPCNLYRVKRSNLPQRMKYSYKTNYGHVLVIGGDLGYSGAARLAGEAALRVGAGLVSIATRKEHVSFMNVGRPELMCHGIDSASQLIGLLDKASVIVLGPGLGCSPWAKELGVMAIDAGKPLVIDADGLLLLAHSHMVSARWILTPHSGEAARLLHCHVNDIERDRFAAAKTIQDNYGGITVLKGPGSLIVSDHDIGIVNTGNPGMASGGMGDVLAGVIAGLLAQGFSPKNAAQQGVYLHGLAGDRAALQLSQRGMLASDLMLHLAELMA